MPFRTYIVSALGLQFRVTRLFKYVVYTAVNIYEYAHQTLVRRFVLTEFT